MIDYVVDFESYYSKSEGISASIQGNYNYCESSYAYCVAIVGPDTRFVGTILEAKEAFPETWWADPAKQFWAANGNFDWEWGRRYFRPDLRPFKCVLDKGAASQLPHDLARLALAVNGKAVDKTTRDWMQGKHFAELPADDQKRVLEYCLGDAVEEYDILHKIPEPSATEDALAEHTRAMNRRGIHIDRTRLEQDKTNLHAYRHRAFLAIPWHNVAKPLSADALARYCNEKGLPVPRSLDKRDEETTELMDVHPALGEVVGAMRRFRRANTLIAKIDSVEARLTSENVLPLEMMYCGARHTRRWSCRGVNIQNLDREPLWVDDAAKEIYQKAVKDDEDVDLSRDFSGGYVWSRHWLVPPPGKLFLSLDYAQIEPRCLHYIAGNEALLDLIRSGYSVYEAYARVAKGWKGEKGTLKKELGVARYTLIKNEVLGLGYGMGKTKYQSYAGVSPQEAAVAVDGFRRANPKVVLLWKGFDEHIALAARKGEPLAVEMLTGDKLIHWGVRVGKYGYESWTTKADYGHGSHQPSLWGGVLTENVTQRFARDVLGEAILRLEHAGFVVAFSAHDELVLAVDRDNREDARREAEHLMSLAPDWAPGLPLAVEGGFSERYEK